MKVRNISGGIQSKRPNYVKITGYAAAASVGVSYAAAKLKKSHRIPGLLGVLFTAAHIGLLESYRFKK